MKHLALVALPFVLVTTAQAEELPTRKAGLWELTMQREGLPPGMGAMQQCTDETTDKDMSTMFGANETACSQKNIQKTATGFVVDATCSIAGAQATTHTVVTGDFNSAYTVDVTSTMNGGPAPGTHHMQLEAKWVGPCKADQHAGDIIMGGGRMKMNIKQMQQLKNMLPKQ